MTHRDDHRPYGTLPGETGYAQYRRWRRRAELRASVVAVAVLLATCLAVLLPTFLWWHRP